MPGSRAQRPGDIVTAMNGKTSEVINTDAEGRLILADAIVRACEDKPDYLIETSTLTGAQTVARDRNLDDDLSGIESGEQGLRVFEHGVGGRRLYLGLNLLRAEPQNLVEEAGQGRADA